MVQCFHLQPPVKMLAPAVEEPAPAVEEPAPAPPAGPTPAEEEAAAAAKKIKLENGGGMTSVSS